MDPLEYDAVARRAFDEPYSRELRDTLRVYGDALEQAGDPRGPLIAFELAALDAEPEDRARQIRRAMRAYALERRADLLGPVEPPGLFDLGLRLEWRAGRIYGAAVNARHLAKKTGLAPAEIVDRFLRAPAAHDLRRLHVRVAEESHCGEVLAMLRRREPRPPLEEIELGIYVRPGRSAPSVPTENTLAAYPNLYYLADTGQLRDLSRSAGATAGSVPERRADEVARIALPTEPEARGQLGRALSALDETTRAAALERVAQLGPAAQGFMRMLTVLLAICPRRQQASIVRVICALGPSRELASALARLASQGNLDEEPRRTAALAAAAMQHALEAG
jgi:hypothetical protein